MADHIVPESPGGYARLFGQIAVSRAHLIVLRLSSIGISPPKCRVSQRTKQRPAVLCHLLCILIWKLMGVNVDQHVCGLFIIRGWEAGCYRLGTIA
jgi:hypothetical protein